MSVVSSTNPNPVTSDLTSLDSSRRLEMKKRKRTGDSVEPWGMPVSVSIHRLSKSPNVIRVRLPVKNEHTIRIIHSGNPLRSRTHSSLSWETLSNAPAISSPSTETTFFFAAQAVWMLPVRSSSAERVDQFFLAPIWFHGRRPLSSASFVIPSAMIFSTIFAIVFSHTIGR